MAGAVDAAGEEVVGAVEAAGAVAEEVDATIKLFSFFFFFFGQVAD